MKFKKWLCIEEKGRASLDKQSNDMFSRRSSNENLQFNLILKSLGLPETELEPTEIGLGSMANVYLNPHNPTQVIKVTGDFADAKNFNKLLKRNIISPNLPRVYNVAKINSKAAAILMDYIKGKKMSYSANEFLALVNGDSWADYQQAIKELQSGRVGKLRQAIMLKKGKNVETESKKLIQLFNTLIKLENIGIDIFDFNEENILDDGQEYVIIDLGQ